MDSRRHTDAAARRASFASMNSSKRTNSATSDFLLSKEWIQMQKNTFTNWANSKLRGTDFQLEDIETDLANGVVLIKLLEVLSHGKRIGRYNEAPNTEARMRDNLDLALKFMEEEEKIQLVNIGSSDIHQGNLKLILGVLWSLVNRYQISDGKKQGNARKLLLAWVNACLPENNIKNFTTDWNDGQNLAALVDYCRPGLFPDHATLDPCYGQRNITRAMQIAENELNVPQVLFPEDLAVDNPDELSVMTYISGFCGPESAGQNSLLEWINKQIPNYPTTNFTTDWCDGHRLGALTDSVSGGRFSMANRMSSYNSIELCEGAMDAAQYFLGIEKTMSPEDFIRDDLSQLSRVTYLTQFQHAESIAPTNASQCIVSNLPEDRLRVSRTYSIKIDTSNTSDSEKLVASAHGPVKGCVVEEVGEDTFAIKFTPFGVGLVHIEATNGDLAIPGSPFEFTVNDPRKVKVNRAAIENGSYQVKQPINFRLSALHAGDGFLSGIVRGPNGEEELEIKAHGSRNYLVHYIPSHAGRHTIILKFDGDDIPGVPIRINVKAEDTSATSPSVKNQAPNDDPLNGNQWKHVYDEIGGPDPISLCVNADFTGEGKLEATCSGRETGSIPAEVIEEEPKKYFVSFFPPKSDVYTVNVRINIEYAPTNPFKLESCNIVNIIEEDVDGAGLTIPFEQPAQFHVFVSDTGCGTLNVISKGPGKVDLKVFENGNGTYTCELKPFIAGKYQVDILFEEQDLNASKFVIASRKRCDLSSALDLGNEAFDVGIPKHFTLNCEELGNGILEVLSAPRTSSTIRVTPVSKTNTYQCEITPIEAGDHQISIKYNGKHILGSPYHVRYEPRKHSSKQPNSTPNEETLKQEVEVSFSFSVDGTGGTNAMNSIEPQPLSVTKRVDDSKSPEADSEGEVYYLMTTSKPQRIQGSPFELNFGPPDTDASKCSATGAGLSECMVQQPANFVVTTSNAGDGWLTVTIADEEGEAVETNISTPDGDQREVQYIPTKPGKHVISVFWDGVQISNSPFTVTAVATTEQNDEETTNEQDAEVTPESTEEPTNTVNDPEQQPAGDDSTTQADEMEQMPEDTGEEQQATMEEIDVTASATTDDLDEEHIQEESQHDIEVEVTVETGPEASADVPLTAAGGDDNDLSNYFFGSSGLFSKPSDEIADDQRNVPNV